MKVVIYETLRYDLIGGQSRQANAADGHLATWTDISATLTIIFAHLLLGTAKKRCVRKVVQICARDMLSGTMGFSEELQAPNVELHLPVREVWIDHIAMTTSAICKRRPCFAIPSGELCHGKVFL